MKLSTLSGVFALLLASASAAPTDNYDDQYSGGRNNGKGRGKECNKGPFKFTSTYSVVATPDQVVNGTTLTGGLPGCTGYFDYGINSEKDLICWSIKLVNFRGNYQSLATTATHIHQGPKAGSGPPRIVFPNPVGEGDVRYSYGCQTGPFKTGILANGVDTGTGFTVKQIEDNPSAFYTDVHSSMAVPGAVRGQLS